MSGQVAGAEAKVADRVNGRIPAVVIRRLSTYYRVLREIERSERATLVSSERLAQLTGFTAAQVRRDLASCGSLGTPGHGYSVRTLQHALRRVLGTTHPRRVALVGAGHLGAALLHHQRFAVHGFPIVAAFDSDPAKYGQQVGGTTIRPLTELSLAVREERIVMAILAVPALQAGAAAHAVVAAGIHAILNFAPATLRVPEHVHVVHVDLSVELEYLAFLLRNPMDS